MQKKKIGSKDFSQLEKLRSELKGQARTFKVEMKDEWRTIERDWRRLKSQMTPVGRTAQKSAGDVKTASVALFNAVRKGYGKIKRRLGTPAASPRAAQVSTHHRAA